MMGNMTGMGSMSTMNDLITNLFNEAILSLGMTTDQFQNELQSRKSFEVISEEQGVKQDKLVKKLKKVIQKEVKQYEKEGNDLLIMNKN